MPAPTNSSGSEIYWLDGEPFDGLSNSNDIGTDKFWIEGVPGAALFPAAVGGATRVPTLMLMGIG